jgi:hypothetical protein
MESTSISDIVLLKEKSDVRGMALKDDSAMLEGKVPIFPISLAIPRHIPFLCKS